MLAALICWMEDPNEGGLLPPFGGDLSENVGAGKTARKKSVEDLLALRITQAVPVPVMLRGRVVQAHASPTGA